MNWLKHTLAVLGTMVVVVGFATVIFPTRASALVATLVRDVDNPARDTFQAFFESTCSGTDGSISCTGLTLPTVNGTGAPISMVVLEYVSAECATASIGFISNYTNAEINSIISSSAVVTNSTSTSGYFLHSLSGSTSGSFSQTTRLYAAPGSTLLAIPNGTTFCVAGVSGYMVTP
jgi:type IV secretory pathway VirB6-like protein